MKIVFIGTPSQYSLYPLEALYQSHQVIAIFQSTNQPLSHSHISTPQILSEIFFTLQKQPSLWNFARKKNIPFFLLSANNFPFLKNFLQESKPDIGCIASMHHLLPEDIFQIPRHGFINFHPSRLPEYRGPNVWFWYYYDMKTEGGVTIHFLDKGKDTGDILKQEIFFISLGMEPKQLMDTAISLGSRLFIESLDEIGNATCQPIKQQRQPCTRRARYLKNNENLFQWHSWSIEHTFHFLRGVSPWYNCFRHIPGIWHIFSWKISGYVKQPENAPAGRILLDKKGFFFSHTQGKIYIKPIIPWFKLFVLILFIFILVKDFLL